MHEACFGQRVAVFHFFQRERHDRHAARIAQHRQPRTQYRIDHRRMHAVIGQTAEQMRRQAQTAEGAFGQRIARLRDLEGRAEAEAHPVECAVDRIGPFIDQGRARKRRGDVDPFVLDRIVRIAEAQFALDADRRIRIAHHFEAQRVAVVVHADRQPVRAVGDLERVHPHQIADAIDPQACFASGKIACSTRHFEVGGARQDLPIAIGMHDMLAQEEFATVETLVIRLHRQRGDIAVDQRMQCFDAAAARPLFLDPVTLGEERHRRERHPLRAIRVVRRRVQRVGVAVPVDIEHRDPCAGQLLQPPVTDQRANQRVFLGIVDDGFQFLRMFAQRAALHCVGGARVSISAQCARQSVDAGGDHRKAFFHGLAADLRRIRQRGQVETHIRVAAAFEERDHALDRARQTLFAIGGQHEQRRSPGGCSRQRSGIVLDQTMRIGTTGTERTQTGAASILPALCAPRLRLLDHAERRVRKIDGRIERGGMQRRRDRVVAELQQDLGEAGDRGGGLQMADIRFDRTDAAGLRRDPRAGTVEFRTRVRERARKAGDLDRIAQRRAGTVRFDVVDAVRVPTGTLQRLADHIGLRGLVRHGEAVGLAAVIQRGTLDDAVDVVAICDRLAQALEQHRADAFARHIAVAAGAERAAAAVGGQELAGGQLQVFVRVRHHVDATGQRQIAVAVVDRPARQVDRGQRRRAHGVEHEARPVEVHEIRHAVGDRRHRRTRPAGLELLVADLELRVILPGHADEHADRLPLERLPGVAGIFEAFPRGLQEQTLLGIHHFRFARRDIEEPRIEQVDVVHEAAPLAIGGSLVAAVRVVETLVIPARRRNFDDAVAPIGQIAPEGLQVVRARIVTAQTDDGDVFVFAAVAGATVAAQAPEFAHAARRSD